MKPLPLKALYTVNELADAIGISRARVKRLLRVCEVDMLHGGRSGYVRLSEIRLKMDPVWQEICEAQRVLAGEE